MTGYDPDTHPAVQAAHDAYAAAVDEHNAYLFASGEALHPWEKAEALAAGETFEVDPAHETEHRLYMADKEYYRTWHAANKEANPGLYRGEPDDGNRLWIRTSDDWRDLYPHVDIPPTPYELCLTSDPGANWDDPDLAASAEREAGPQAEDGL